MHSTRVLAAAVFLAVAHARFGEEGAVQGIIGAIGGNNGQAATLAGASIGTLLAGANACAKLALADQVAALTGAGALDAAKALVQAEKNFNPFVVTVPSICSDPTLPATAALRGILPLIDPAVPGAEAANSASAASLTNPLNADGLSVADLVEADGSVNFTPQSSAGVVGAEVVAGGNGGGGAAGNVAAPVASAVAPAAPAATVAAPAPAANAADNLQTFAGKLGAAASPITFSGDETRPFEVNGATFVNFSAAAARTCDVQFNACANAANRGQNISLNNCNKQKTACTAAQAAATVTSFSAGAAAAGAGAGAEAEAEAEAEACPSPRLRRREEAEKRAEKSRRLALIRTISQKRAELAALEEQLL